MRALAAGRVSGQPAVRAFLRSAKAGFYTSLDVAGALTETAYLLCNGQRLFNSCLSYRICFAPGSSHLAGEMSS